MTTQNGFDDLIIIRSGIHRMYSLDHLENLQIVIDAFEFEDGRKDQIMVHVRPTNHVYSRKLEPSDDYQKLRSSGELLLKYAHYQDNPQQIKTASDGSPKIDGDKRVFCPDKYQSSILLPDFIAFLNQRPSHVAVLPNPGDTRTCLSALFALPEPYENNQFLLMFFTLHKKSATDASMVIETAFVVHKDDFRAEMLTEGKYKNKRKPFITLLKNIFAGRKPFESLARKRLSKAHKQIKLKRKARK